MAATNDHATARLRQRKSIDVCLSEIRPNFGHEFDSPKLFLRGLEKRVRYSDVKNFFAEFIFLTHVRVLVHEARPLTPRLLRGRPSDRRADLLFAGSWHAIRMTTTRSRRRIISTA